MVNRASATIVLWTISRESREPVSPSWCFPGLMELLRGTMLRGRRAWAQADADTVISQVLTCWLASCSRWTQLAPIHENRHGSRHGNMHVGFISGSRSCLLPTGWLASPVGFLDRIPGRLTMYLMYETYSSLGPATPCSGWFARHASPHPPEHVNLCSVVAHPPWRQHMGVTIHEPGRFSHLTLGARPSSLATSKGCWWNQGRVVCRRSHCKFVPWSSFISSWLI